MKRKENKWGWLKETWCFFVGHNWKTSWRHRADRDYVISLDYQRADKDKIPYARRQSGNLLCEYSEGWHFKCRRCRMRTRDDPWYPWYKNFYRAFKSFWHCWWIGATYYTPKKYGWSAFLWSQLTAPMFGWEQSYLAWAYEQRWPWWPGIIVSELNHWIHEHKIEKW